MVYYKEEEIADNTPTAAMMTTWFCIYQKNCVKLPV